MIKVLAPNVAVKVIDWAMQAHGGEGVSDDLGLAHAYAMARALRIADGPDEVHRDQIARLELGKFLVTLGRVDDRWRHRRPPSGLQALSHRRRNSGEVSFERAGVGRLEPRGELHARLQEEG